MEFDYSKVEKKQNNAFNSLVNANVKLVDRNKVLEKEIEFLKSDRAKKEKALKYIHKKFVIENLDKYEEYERGILDIARILMGEYDD